jgi:hypothetical protein
METGIISETKYGKTRVAQIKTSVFATSNNIKNLSAPLQSRFFIVELEPYTHEQFLDITITSENGRSCKSLASAVWARIQDMRDCIKIGSMAKTMEDVDFLINMLHSQKCK